MIKRELKTISLALILIVAVSMIVSAIGSSTEFSSRDDSTEERNSATASGTDINQTNESVVERCDSYTDRTERIKCRLENIEEIEAAIVERYREFNDDASTYEACQNLRNEGLCVALYARSYACYQMEGENKDRCFKAVANFTQAKLDQEVGQVENKTMAREKVREYMVLVLYNLQERVEKAVKAERITVDEGAEIINKIVEIKRLILDGVARETIRQEIQELRTMWRTSLTNE